MKPRYYLDGNEFVIEDYNRAKPFSSFLPGIAGLHGKPLWAFYVNRGQCVASFGQTSKEGAIMEFYPANTSYRRTSLEGFRTFVRIRDGAGQTVYEPFRVVPAEAADATVQKLFVSMAEFRIEEVSKANALRFEAVYFTVPGEDFPALARILTVEDLSGRSRGIEIVDGMPKLCPYGMNEFFMKHMSRTIEAWMEVSGLAERTPFYRLRVDAADTSETKYITSGNFYLGRLADGSKPAVIVEPAVVFGDYGDLSYPGAFAARDFAVPETQIDRNITPAAFSCSAHTLEGNGMARVYSLIGHASSLDEVKKIDRRMGAGYIDAKRAENRRTVEELASSVSVFSGMPEFDLYVRQTNLDNILRGGYPVSVKGAKKLIYVFNRKHGDLERDYNNFVLNPEPYSQGNGNFRDANQNRRLSVWLNPAVGTKDIRDFYGLIQLDGYNPLVVKGDRFCLKDKTVVKRLASLHFGGKAERPARAFLAGCYTLGELIKFAGRNGVKDADALIAAVIAAASSRIEAEHGEGYWVDHWTYNLDLVESYLALYPEKRHELLFRDREYAFFDNAHVVKPRRERIVPGAGRKARQYHGVVIDEGKRRLIAARRSDPSWARSGNGRGDIYRCTLAAKMLVIIANKIATVDPAGVGIEMEADKPGWCDSLNGLPALVGSSLSETLELARSVAFLKDSFAQAQGVSIPAELAVFIGGLTRLLARDARSTDKGKDFRYWDRANTLKERYRSRTRLGISGREKALDKEDAVEFLSLAFEKLETAIRKGRDRAGIPYTYFINEMRCPGKGRAKAPASSKPLPLYLEAPVHAMKLSGRLFDARSLYAGVRSSALYDKPLGMYKLNAPLEGEGLEIGRSRFFTPGWLENESVWLHMEYKFLLEVLKAGLYDEFFTDLKACLIPFQDAERYGRSILENSSFIACSAFFDPKLRGNGFIARLSGATAEFLHMLLIMNLGRSPFTVEGGELRFTPAPALPASFFARSGREVEFAFRGGRRKTSIPPQSYAFSLFEHTLVIYTNPQRKDAYGEKGVKPVEYALRYADGTEKTVKAASLGAPYAEELRNGSVDTLSILLG